MKKIILAGLVSFTSLCLSAQTQDLEGKVLFTVDDDTVTAGEYMAVYNKNRNLGEDIDPKTPREYLDLYINFKLKVHEARELGMDTLPSFRREYNSYRDQLAKPYLSDKDVTIDLMKEAYARMQEDVRASHIMVAIPENAAPADTLAAWEKIVDIEKKLKQGADFAQLAQQYSNDTYSAKRGGDLGYFTVFSMVYPFETAAYNTEVGEISEVVRSRFGYHLVKTTDRRPARGEITVSHIMLIANGESSEEDKAKAKAKAEELYTQLQAGADFATLARQHSEDERSARQGGRLKPFGINKMFPEFEEASFSIAEVGQYSQPIKTPVGYHIIRLEARPEMADYDKLESTLKRQVDNDSRSQQSKLSILKKLKKEYELREYPKALNAVFEQVDESFLKGEFEAEGINNADELLFEFANQKRTAGDFASFLSRQANQRSLSLSTALERAYETYVENQILAYEKSRLEEKYPEFRLLSREYFEGILLFDLTEEKVWRRSVNDTLGLQEFFAANRENYRWKDRYDVVIVDAASKRLAKKAVKMLRKGASIEQVEGELNADSQLNLSMDSSRVELGSNPMLDAVEEKEGFSKIMKEDGRYFAIQFLHHIPAGPKALEEARGAVISDYQSYLEQQWLNELKKQYEVQLNEGVLENTLERLESES